MDRPVDRRTVLLLGTALALAGCTTRSESGSPAASLPTNTVPGSPPSTATPTTSGSTAPPSTDSAAAKPPAAAWAPDPSDIQPEVKLAAVQYVQASVQPQVQVVFAQYGGLLADQASVLVVTRPSPAVADPAVGSTYDVRLVRSASAWQVTAVHPSEPGAAAPTVSATAGQVLAEARIDLPPAARADIASGQVHESVLQAMLTLSQDFRIAVSVVRSGHPVDVFGTSRPSDHPLGKAFDTWQIDDQSVVAATTPQSLVTAYMQAAARVGSYNVGGPYPLSGSAFFSDPTHHDHVHAGFRA